MINTVILSEGSAGAAVEESFNEKILRFAQDDIFWR